MNDTVDTNSIKFYDRKHYKVQSLKIFVVPANLGHWDVLEIHTQTNLTVESSVQYIIY